MTSWLATLWNRGGTNKPPPLQGTTKTGDGEEEEAFASEPSPSIEFVVDTSVISPLPAWSGSKTTPTSTSQTRNAFYVATFDRKYYHLAPNLGLLCSSLEHLLFSSGPTTDTIYWKVHMVIRKEYPSDWPWDDGSTNDYKEEVQNAAKQRWDNLCKMARDKTTDDPRFRRGQIATLDASQLANDFHIVQSFTLNSACLYSFLFKEREEKKGESDDSSSSSDPPPSLKEDTPNGNTLFHVAGSWKMATQLITPAAKRVYDTTCVQYAKFGLIGNSYRFHAVQIESLAASSVVSQYPECVLNTYLGDELSLDPTAPKNEPTFILQEQLPRPTRPSHEQVTLWAHLLQSAIETKRTQGLSVSSLVYLQTGLFLALAFADPQGLCYFPLMAHKPAGDEARAMLITLGNTATGHKNTHIRVGGSTGRTFDECLSDPKFTMLAAFGGFVHEDSVLLRWSQSVHQYYPARVSRLFPLVVFHADSAVAMVDFPYTKCTVDDLAKMFNDGTIKATDTEREATLARQAVHDSSLVASEVPQLLYVNYTTLLRHLVTGARPYVENLQVLPLSIAVGAVGAHYYMRKVDEVLPHIEFVAAPSTDRAECQRISWSDLAVINKMPSALVDKTITAPQRFYFGIYDELFDFYEPKEASLLTLRTWADLAICTVNAYKDDWKKEVKEPTETTGKRKKTKRTEAHRYPTRDVFEQCSNYINPLIKELGGRLTPLTELFMDDIKDLYGEEVCANWVIPTEGGRTITDATPLPPSPSPPAQQKKPPATPPASPSKPSGKAPPSSPSPSSSSSNIIPDIKQSHFAVNVGILEKQWADTPQTPEKKADTTYADLLQMALTSSYLAPNMITLTSTGHAEFLASLNNAKPSLPTIAADKIAPLLYTPLVANATDFKSKGETVLAKATKSCMLLMLFQENYMFLYRLANAEYEALAIEITRKSGTVETAVRLLDVRSIRHYVRNKTQKNDPEGYAYIHDMIMAAFVQGLGTMEANDPGSLVRLLEADGEPNAFTIVYEYMVNSGTSPDPSNLTKEREFPYTPGLLAFTEAARIGHPLILDLIVQKFCIRLSSDAPLRNNDKGNRWRRNVVNQMLRTLPSTAYYAMHPPYRLMVPAELLMIHRLLEEAEQGEEAPLSKISGPVVDVASDIEFNERLLKGTDVRYTEHMQNLLAHHLYVRDQNPDRAARAASKRPDMDHRKDLRMATPGGATEGFSGQFLPRDAETIAELSNSSDGKKRSISTHLIRVVSRTPHITDAERLVASHKRMWDNFQAIAIHQAEQEIGTLKKKKETGKQAVIVIDDKEPPAASPSSSPTKKAIPLRGGRGGRKRKADLPTEQKGEWEAPLLTPPSKPASPEKTRKSLPPRAAAKRPALSEQSSLAFPPSSPPPPPAPSETPPPPTSYPRPMFQRMAGAGRGYEDDSFVSSLASHPNTDSSDDENGEEEKDEDDEGGDEHDMLHPEESDSDGLDIVPASFLIIGAPPLTAEEMRVLPEKELRKEDESMSTSESVVTKQVRHLTKSPVMLLDAIQRDTSGVWFDELSNMSSIVNHILNIADRQHKSEITRLERSLVSTLSIPLLLGRAAMRLRKYVDAMTAMRTDLTPKDASFETAFEKHVGPWISSFAPTNHWDDDEFIKTVLVGLRMLNPDAALDFVAKALVHLDRALVTAALSCDLTAATGEASEIMGPNYPHWFHKSRWSLNTTKAITEHTETIKQGAGIMLPDEYMPHEDNPTRSMALSPIFKPMSINATRPNTKVIDLSSDEDEDHASTHSKHNTALMRAKQAYHARRLVEKNLVLVPTTEQIDLVGNLEMFVDTLQGQPLFNAESKSVQNLANPAPKRQTVKQKLAKVLNINNIEHFTCFVIPSHVSALTMNALHTADRRELLSALTGSATATDDEDRTRFKELVKIFALGPHNKTSKPTDTSMEDRLINLGYILRLPHRKTKNPSEDVTRILKECDLSNEDDAQWFMYILLGSAAHTADTDAAETEIDEFKAMLKARMKPSTKTATKANGKR